MAKKDEEGFSVPLRYMGALIEVVINIMLYGLKIFLLLPALLYWGSKWEKNIKTYFKWAHI